MKLDKLRIPILEMASPDASINPRNSNVIEKQLQSRNPAYAEIRKKIMEAGGPPYFESLKESFAVWSNTENYRGYWKWAPDTLWRFRPVLSKTPQWFSKKEAEEIKNLVTRRCCNAYLYSGLDWLQNNHFYGEYYKALQPKTTPDLALQPKTTEPKSEPESDDYW
jgi:hypothetical protein